VEYANEACALGRLCSRCNEPGRRAAKDAQKFPSPHECATLGKASNVLTLTCWKGLVAMSALGQKRTCAAQEGMSALPPIATAKANCRKRSCLLHPRKQTDAGQNEMSAVSHKRSGSHDQFIRRDREERHELVCQRKLAE